MAHPVGGALGERARKRAFGRDLAVLLGVSALATALRLYDLTGESLWYDEAYSVWSSSMEIASLQRLWEWQIEFPLFYLMLHYWMGLFGRGEWAVRAFSALAGILTMVPMYYLGEAILGRGVGAMGALLLAVNPYHIWYSQEVRMYAWAMLLTLASLYAFWRLAMQQGRPLKGRWGWWGAYALLSGLVFHLHYYIGWLLVAENVYYLGLLVCTGRRGEIADKPRAVSAWRELGWWLLGQLVILLIALPAFAVFRTKLLTFNQWGWLAQRYGAPGLAHVVDLLVAFTTGISFQGSSMLRWLTLGAFLGLALWVLFRTLAWRDARMTWLDGQSVVSRGGLLFICLALALPVALVFLLGQFTTAWVPRYLILFMPAYLLLVAIGARRLRGVLAGVALALALLGSMYALYGLYAGQQKEDWRGVVGYLRRQIQPADVLVLMDEECRVPFDYYADRQALPQTAPRVPGYDWSLGVKRVGLSRFASEAQLDAAARQMLEELRFASVTPSRLWVVLSHADGAGLLARLDRTENLRRTETPSFVGVDVVAYSLGSAP
ncbi:MAG: glycosyltransferase family 39 protein [Anaerolineae bacterium]|nr:glycosyltransferase family 39 protein [Anaerolineae bacterium]